MGRILLVDDDEDFRQLVVAQVGEAHDIEAAANAEEALGRLDAAAYDAVLTDLQMPPGIDGIELIQRARRNDVDAPFVVLTGQATVETAVHAMRQGAFDYLRKGASRDEILAAIDRAVAHGRMEREVRRLRREVSPSSDRPIGSCPSFVRALTLAERVAAADASVLVLGESGTGKELIARAIHRWSPRRQGPFVAFDCSALSPTLMEAELFGHERGAYTGAEKARRGLFREAGGGTLFLDEIGDIAPEVQNKLLRVLQEREIKPVGADAFVKIDVRVVAATNKDLQQLVKTGRFREDLYYRLAVVQLELPPLRDRLEDLPELVAFFLGRRKGAGPRPTRLSAGAMARLSAYRWPGNIRELENVIERGAILSDGREIVEQDLPPLGERSTPVAPTPPGAVALAVDPSLPLRAQLDEAVARIEREAIVMALRMSDGSPTKACRRLGISRASLYMKIKEYGVPL